MKNTILKSVLAVLLVASFALTSWGAKKDKRLDIYWVDVEGGAATLIVTPQGESILIDSGNPGFRDPNRIAQAITKTAGLQQLDFLITTHYHGDHFGGAEALSRLLPIKAVYDNGEFEGMPEHPGKAYFSFAAGSRSVINPGDTLPLAQSAEEDSAQVAFRCIGTRQQFIQPATDAPSNKTVCATAREKDRDGSDNANSVVMLLEFGGFRFYDGGDVTWNNEKKLVCPVNLIGEIDVYQVTHHGLDSSNNPLVLNSLLPTVAVFNNGHTKGCMPEVFTNLTATKSIQAIYQGHKNLRPDGATNNTADDYIANHGTPEECKANIIKLSVAPHTKSYTISIPANDHTRTYQTKIQ